MRGFRLATFDGNNRRRAPRYRQLPGTRNFKEIKKQRVRLWIYIFHRLVGDAVESWRTWWPTITKEIP